MRIIQGYIKKAIGHIRSKFEKQRADLLVFYPDLHHN